MTEYEIADLALSNASLIKEQAFLMQEGGGLVVDNLTLFYSLLFGYLLAAYAIGQKLSRIQVSILTILYLAAVAYNRFFGFIIFRESLLQQSVTDEMLKATSSPTLASAAILTPDLTSVQAGMLAFVMSFVAMAVLASLLFMWSVRHPRED
jgi:hypothetical protein